MKLVRKIVFLSIVPTIVMLAGAEFVSRCVVSWVRNDPQVWHYGSTELHRFLFEDRAAIVKKQGTFFIEKGATLNPDDYDLTQGDFARHRYYTFKKPPQTYRLLVFGGSAVFSVTTSADQSFPAQLERMLNARGDASHFEVLNMGLAGRTSKEIKRLQRSGFRFEHDMEIFYHLRNDFFMPHIVESRPEFFVRQLHNIAFRLSVLYSSLHRVVVKATGHEMTTENAEEIFQRYRRHVEDLIQAAQAKGVSPVIVKQAVDMTFISTRDGWYPVFTAAYEKSLEALDEIGAEFGVPVIDAATPLLTQKTPIERKVWFYDDVHLTEEGNMVLSALVADALVQLHPGWFGPHQTNAEQRPTRRLTRALLTE